MGRVIEFNTTSIIITKMVNFIEFFTIKFCSSFKRILIRNGGTIIKINSSDKIKSFKANILKKTDKKKLNNNKNEPISLHKPSFLPRMLIYKIVLDR